MQARKKGDAFFVYAIPTLGPGMQQHKIPIQYQDYIKSLFNTKTTKMFLKRKMQTNYLNIGHMIVQLIWRKVHSPHLDPSIICYETNFQRFENTSTKILKRGSFDIQSLQLVLQSYLLRKKWIFKHVCWLPWTKSIHHQEPIPFALDFRIVGPTQSCQNVHQNWPMWSIQLGAHSRRWQMEDNA
jgi:hypothetical protein